MNDSKVLERADIIAALRYCASEGGCKGCPLGRYDGITCAGFSGMLRDAAFLLERDTEPSNDPLMLEELRGDGRGAGMTDRELIQALTEEFAPRIRELCADDKLDCDQLCAGNILTAKCIVFQAAERLAALRAENAELRARHRTEHCEASGYDCAELGRLRTALARVETEREMLLEYAGTQVECEMCKNDAFCPAVNPMPENCAVCELKPRCPCHPCKWEWRGAQGEG